MSKNLDEARIIAQRIARRVAAHSPATNLNSMGDTTDLNSELAAVRSGLSDLQNRLGRIEARIRSGGGPTSSSSVTDGAPPALRTHSPWLTGVNASVAHPSQERFGIEEATVAELVDYFQKEKTCSVEPGGKPCDHCAMCSSRGF
jgi:hypothetical protein